MTCKFFILLTSAVSCLSFVRSQYEPYGENVAFRKAAHQSTTYTEHGFMYNASLGVDGKISTTFADKTCSHTDVGSNYSWWTVDLDGFYFTKFIRIYQRNEESANRMKGSEMYVRVKDGTWQRIYFNSTKPPAVFNVSVNLDKPIGDIMLNKSQSGPVGALFCVCELEVFKVIQCSNYSIGKGSITVVQYGDSNQTFTYGTKLNVTCHEGYRMSDDGVVTNETESDLECNATGNWSRNLTCSIVVCGWPPNIPNNSKQTLTPGIAGDTTYNATLTVECNEGYSYSLQETESIRCSDDGVWAGQLGNCNAIQCGLRPTSPSNGVLITSPGIDGDTSYNATMTVVCNEGYNYTYPGSETARCKDDGVWETIVGNCKAIECFIIFNINNGEIKVKTTGVDGKNNTYGVKLSVECDSGFTSNVLEITCLDSGLSSQPVCSADPKPTYLTAAIVGSVATFITVVTLVVGIVIFMRRRKKHKDDETRNFDQNKEGGKSIPAEMDFQKGFKNKKRSNIPDDSTIAHQFVASGHRLQVKEENSAYEIVEDFDMENIKSKSIGLDTNAMETYDTLQTDNGAKPEYDELKFERESSLETTMKNET